MRNFRRFLLSLIILLCASSTAWAQAVATLADDELLMGKTMPLRVVITLPADTSRVEFPLLQEALRQNKKYVSFVNDTIELLTKFSRAIENEGNGYAMRYDLTVQAFDSGRYEIPALDFLVDGKQIRSNPVSLSVIPVKVKADDKLDDFSSVAEPFEINPYPEEMEEGAAALIWWIIAAAVLLLLGALAFFLFRRNGKFSLLPKAPAPYQVALDRLRKLRKQNLPQKGKTKEYYTRLTDILIYYLKKQFGIKTYEKTSTEILSQIEGDERLDDYLGVLKSIFETADFVKFAKVNPSEVENTRCLNDAYRFVEVSHPAETEEKKKGDRRDA